MKRLDQTRLLSLATFAALAACSSGGGGTTGSATTTTSDFLYLKSEPISGQTIYLNEPISVDFSTGVDLDSASLATVTFQALDQLGNPLQELVSGNFNLSVSPGDSVSGVKRRLQFVPRFASNDAYDDGGLRAGRTYLVRLIGSESANNPTVLRSIAGRALGRGVTFTFNTREGTQPGQLYKNPKAGGPVRSGLSVTSANNLDSVPLGLFGAPPLEVRLDFDQALNPSLTNVPTNLDVNPVSIDPSKRGRIFLEYDDPVLGPNRWIPASLELERNDLTGATVALRPVGVLPNNATIRVIVEATLEDISGESNSGSLSYSRVFGTFTTQESYDQQWNGIVEDFNELGNLDLTAAFPEAQAEVGSGYLKAGFAFEGNSTSLEYEPTANEIVLNTAFTQIVPKAGLPFTVSGGVFNFKNVTIPQGVTVIGQGPNPMVWLCSGKFTVAGTLTVRGGQGARVDTLNSANYAKAGGVGVCGGGNGGDGTPSATQRDLRGGTGRGPLQEAGKGGRGGYIACLSGCYQGSGYAGSGGGSGGGGGTLATQGDPNWRGSPGATLPNVSPTGNTNFQQKQGYGGSGCSGGPGSRSAFLLGGEPGDRVFVDARQDNNFWGSGINVNRGLRITGELSQPIGGGGGGGGGDTAWTPTCSLTASDPANDYSGGGGGGGGGVLIVKALDDISILSTGNINANGGNGGGGEQVGSCGEAGGGGAGAGGMVILMSASSIRIEAHGSTAVTPNRFLYGAGAGAPYLGSDYSFAISADGGVCVTGGFGTVNITDKYPGAGQAMMSGATYDQDPLGALGGMGIVQLMVPPGENLVDATNTRLDDNIKFYLPGQLSLSTIPAELPAAAKKALLAWRGFPNAGGAFVDDFGVATNIGDNEGDIRPSPTLLPAPFGAKSRARSKWIDTGASQRRQLTTADGQARGLLMTPGVQGGPKFEFAGLNNSAPFTAGYAAYSSVGSTAVSIDYPVVVSGMPLGLVESSATYLGKPAYRATLTAPNAALGTANRYVAYEAELLNASGSKLAGYRILNHTDSVFLLDIGEDLLPVDATQLQIRAKFYKVVTNGSEGLGRLNNLIATPTPISNVRVGFAFHRNPNTTNILTNRYPSTSEQDFVHDLSDAGLLAWINSASNPDGAGVWPRYVQWDVTFDMAYQPAPNSPTKVLEPSTPRPELHFLRLPFRF